MVRCPHFAPPCSPSSSRWRPACSRHRRGRDRHCGAGPAPRPDGVAEFEDLLEEGGDGGPYVDTAAFVDWYLVAELFKNLDSDFYSSIFHTWRPGQPSAMGPVWDFDLSSGYPGGTAQSYGEPTGWWVRGSHLADTLPEHPLHDTHWFARLLDDPRFAALVKARWAELSPVAETDDEVWPEHPWWAMEHGDNPAEEVAYLAGWLTSRIAWLDGQLA
ncbi:CotH kinase family protein [Nocardioides sp. W7]|uniref:CotH kinase family protein n=1 Tax=Nocardioides sp. W7 TaxID=2931390 RepID=UPI001FD554CB|nr:CotH kinase family protein [Nocardioides sp. W7]